MQTVDTPIDAAIDAAVDVPIDHDRASVNGVELHYVTAGPPDGDLVVCLHGFPEFWYTWHRQIPALVDAGYRVVAPDMRGANRSAKPDRVSAYHLRELAADVAGLTEHFDRESARIVSHDFGGLAAWWLAARHPAVVDRLVVLDAPHPAVFERHLRSSLDQLRRSNYVAFFQLPWLPEFAIRRDDHAAIHRLFRAHLDPATLSTAAVERFRVAAAREGAVRGMLNWYRATVRWYLRRRLRGKGLPDLHVDVPTLVGWGEWDHALAVGMAADHDSVVADLEIEVFADASHWVQFDATERVNDALLEFL